MLVAAGGWSAVDTLVVVGWFIPVLMAAVIALWQHAIGEGKVTQWRMDVDRRLRWLERRLNKPHSDDGD